MNDKSQVTRKRLYSEKINRGRVSGIMKEVSAELKYTEKQKEGLKPYPQLPGLRKGKLKMLSQDKSNGSDNRLAILAAR
jgi:hypothetical protein